MSLPLDAPQHAGRSSARMDKTLGQRTGSLFLCDIALWTRRGQKHYGPEGDRSIMDPKGTEGLLRPANYTTLIQSFLTQEYQLRQAPSPEVIASCPLAPDSGNCCRNRCRIGRPETGEAVRVGEMTARSRQWHRAIMPSFRSGSTPP